MVSACRSKATAELLACDNNTKVAGDRSEATAELLARDNNTKVAGDRSGGRAIPQGKGRQHRRRQKLKRVSSLTEVALEGNEPGYVARTRGSVAISVLDRKLYHKSEAIG